MRNIRAATMGIVVAYSDSLPKHELRESLEIWLASVGIPRTAVHYQRCDLTGTLNVSPAPKYSEVWLPDGDTTGITQRLGLNSYRNPADLECEILIAMLGSPIPFDFPSLTELECTVRVRRNIVEAARVTALAFETSSAERPANYWRYVEGNGFLILPQRSIVEALKFTTQPEISGQLYSFSCYRATEYVILLAIAQELEAFHPQLYLQLQRQMQMRAIQSGVFHRVFLREYGSRENPLPARYYVPGDRLWFRNPDAASSDASGFEGSWLFYMGGGHFSNFWKRNRAFTLRSKCLEIYHWRHGTYVDPKGDLRMNEAIVAEHVQQSLLHAEEVEHIEEHMMRLADPSGVYATGGIIDRTREYPVCLCPGTAELRLPEGSISLRKNVHSELGS